MPKELERKLRAEAKLKFPKNKVRQNRYVFGTMIKLGVWKPKGKRMSRNHKHK